MPETKGQRQIRVYEKMKADRASLESYWQDLMYYNLPRKAYITRIKNSGDRIPTDIYDSTAIIAASYFAAGMQAYLSSPQSKWFSIGLRNRTLEKESKAVRTYLKDTEDELYHIINNSNFYGEDVESYLNLGVIGTDLMYSEEDLDDVVRFDSLAMESVVIGTDARGVANSAYMEYEFNAEQAIGKFGKKAGEKAIEALLKLDFSKKFKYIFGVYPRDIYDQSKKDAVNMKYAALWVDRETKDVVRESGYKEFPFFLTRFTKYKQDAYGDSPAMNILPDVQMLNSMEKVNILGAQMTVLPPLEIPDEAFLKPYNFNPGGPNIKQAGYPNEHITPINVGANVPLGLDYLQHKQRGIQQAYYNDLFLLFEQVGNATATEVSIRNNQRMQLLGSAIGNIMKGKLSPAITRTYNIAARNGRLPPVPEELRGSEYVINYISPLAKAQQSFELQNFERGMAIIRAMGEINPMAFDKIDIDESVDYVSRLSSMNPKVIRDDAEVADLRTDRAEAQAIEAEMLAIREGAETTKIAAGADKEMAQAAATGAK